MSDPVASAPLTGAPDVERAASALAAALPYRPRVALVLGSGLGQLVDELVEPTSVSFGELPGFPASTVTGHEGRYVAGRLGSTEVLFQCGRYHLYEGHAPDVVVAPVRVAAALGVDALVLTNAAGGVRQSLEPGDLVLLEDHINLMARSPLVGRVQAGEVRFPDMSEPYDVGLREIAIAAARETGVALTGGVYAGMLGPAFETAAEVRMLATMGADVVGMSTVPEVLAARARGVRCLGFSVVTNKATGLGGGEVTHEEVLAVGRDAGQRLARLLRVAIPRLAGPQSGSTK